MQLKWKKIESILQFSNLVCYGNKGKKLVHEDCCKNFVSISTVEQPNFSTASISTSQPYRLVWTGDISIWWLSKVLFPFVILPMLMFFVWKKMYLCWSSPGWYSFYNVHTCLSQLTLALWLTYSIWQDYQYFTTFCFGIENLVLKPMTTKERSKYKQKHLQTAVNEKMERRSGLRLKQ